VSEGLFGGEKGHSSPDGHLGDREKLSWTGNDGDGSFQREKKRKGLSKGANLHRPGRRGRIRKPDPRPRAIHPPPRVLTGRGERSF
jgi:hypothetical protein